MRFMYLERITISNYRLIESLEMWFEPGSTVIIGENASGKSSVLSLLARVLGTGSDDRAALVVSDDLHRSGSQGSAESEDQTLASPVVITLTFRTRDDDDERLPRGIEPLLGPSEPRWVDQEERPRRRGEWGQDEPVRRLRVRVTAHPDDAPAGRFVRVDSEGGEISGGPIDAELASLLRVAFPVIRLRPEDRLPLRGGERATTARGSAFEQMLLEAAERISASPEQVRAEDEPEAVDAARRLIRHQLRELRRSGAGDSGRTIRLLRQGGSGTESLLAVLLLGEILRSRGDVVVRSDARPVIIIEEAEAHLHPIALAGIWELIEGLPAQRIITTNSSDLLGWTPLAALRRLSRFGNGVRAHAVALHRFDGDELRRIRHHVSRTRSGAYFARCWLLVEGETEVWLLPEMARGTGILLPREGVRCLEFAQCGIVPLIRLADQLGIEWHALVDGDRAGDAYAKAAVDMLRGRPEGTHLTRLREPDIELCLWNHGYEEVFRRYAGRPKSRGKASEVIELAIRAASKPALALAVVESALDPDGPGVPPVLQAVLGKVLRLARK